MDNNRWLHITKHLGWVGLALTIFFYSYEQEPLVFIQQSLLCVILIGIGSVCYLMPSLGRDELLKVNWCHRVLFFEDAILNLFVILPGVWKIESVPKKGILDETILINDLQPQYGELFNTLTVTYQIKPLPKSGGITWKDFVCFVLFVFKEMGTYANRYAFHVGGVCGVMSFIAILYWLWEYGTVGFVAALGAAVFGLVVSIIVIGCLISMVGHILEIKQLCLIFLLSSIGFMLAFLVEIEALQPVLVVLGLVLICFMARHISNPVWGWQAEGNYLLRHSLIGSLELFIQGYVLLEGRDEVKSMARSDGYIDEALEALLTGKIYNFKDNVNFFEEAFRVTIKTAEIDLSDFARIDLARNQSELSLTKNGKVVTSFKTGATDWEPSGKLRVLPTSIN